MSSLSQREKELFAKLDEVIHYLWDPIGISSLPSARGEYHMYSSKVFQMVKQGMTKEEVAEYLTKVQTEFMSLKETKEKNRRVVSVIFSWAQYIKESEEK